MTPYMGLPVTRALFEIEAFFPHERPEVRPLRNAVLPRLVLRPAVERDLAPARRVARLVGMDRGAAAIVGVDAAREIALVVAVLVHRALQPEPRADVTRVR